MGAKQLVVQEALETTLVLGRKVTVVDTQYNGASVALGGCGNDHFLGSRLDMTGGQFLGHEQARTLDNHVDSELAPRKSGRTLTESQAANFLPVDDQRILGRSLDRPIEATLSRIVLQEIGQVVGGDQVVDGDDLELIAKQSLVDQGAKNQTANATETINSNFSRHLRGICKLGIS